MQTLSSTPAWSRICTSRAQGLRCTGPSSARSPLVTCSSSIHHQIPILINSGGPTTPTFLDAPSRTTSYTWRRTAGAARGSNSSTTLQHLVSNSCEWNCGFEIGDVGRVGGVDDQIICCNFECRQEGRARLLRGKYCSNMYRNEGLNRKSRVVGEGR